MDCMRNMMVALLTLLLTGFLSVVYAAETHVDSPIGYWRIIDKTTGQPKSIVQIWRTTDQILMGRVVKIFPQQSENQIKLCTACKGDKHNRPIVGMVVM